MDITKVIAKVGMFAATHTLTGLPVSIMAAGQAFPPENSRLSIVKHAHGGSAAHGDYLATFPVGAVYRQKIEDGWLGTFS